MMIEIKIFLVKTMSDNIEYGVGSCKLRIGPMFSGKTSAVVQEGTTLADIGMEVMYINHSDDIRSTTSKSKNMTTHHSTKKSLSDKIDTISTKKLSKINIDKYDVIIVDEAQFFNDLEVTVRHWVLELNKIVYVASLDGDFNMKSFGQVKELLCIADDVKKFSAKCMSCIKKSSPKTRINTVPAPFTGKIGGNIVGPQKDVGGSDKYMALCMKCHKHNK